MSQAFPRFQHVADVSAMLSERLSRVTEIVVIGLLILLVLDVWLGIMVRYFVDLPLTFTEEAARYLMIWMALLAVSVGISKRSHIGVLFIFDRTSGIPRHVLMGLIDLLGLAFFLFLFYYGLGFTSDGARRLTMIYDIPKSVPFAAVPTACLLAAIQIALVSIRDQAALLPEPDKSNVDL
ncbi:MAG: TRAP transporter small permease [Gammaproteobacteria bacterium]